MIEVRNVTKRYHHITALDNVTLRIPRGEVIGILGPNGAGKSTLFKIIAGILSADAGSVQPNNGKWPIMAYKPDRLLYPNHLRVRDYLVLFANLSNIPRKEQADRIMDSLARVDLLDSADKKISGLSKGMRQRLGLAQTLIGEPSLILLDEPSNGLDPTGQIEIQEEIRKLHANGKTLLISTHQLNEVTAVCTHIIILSNGRIRYANSVEAALAMRPHVNIEVDKSAELLTPWLHQIDPAITVNGAQIMLAEDAVSARRQVLTLLLGAGYDIVNLEHRRITLDEIYAEAVA